VDLREHLESEYLPRLQSLRAVLAERYPEFRFDVQSAAVGSLTDYQGHVIYLECTFVGRPHDKSDNVAFMIRVCHLDRRPRLMADVAWGAPESWTEESLDPNWTTNEEWPQADADTLRRLAHDFQRLLEAFKRAVARGTPLAES
jgi:hypothetical protein